MGGSLLTRAPDKAAGQGQFPCVSHLTSQGPQASFISSVMQQSWSACRSAKGGLYAWSQSTPNSIILERVSCVSSTERLFTCTEPRCYFASPTVFIMMALFCLSLRRLLLNIDCHFALCVWSEPTIRVNPLLVLDLFPPADTSLMSHFLSAYLRFLYYYKVDH